MYVSRVFKSRRHDPARIRTFRPTNEVYRRDFITRHIEKIVSNRRTKLRSKFFFFHTGQNTNGEPPRGSSRRLLSQHTHTHSLSIHHPEPVITVNAYRLPLFGAVQSLRPIISSLSLRSGQLMRFTATGVFNMYISISSPPPFFPVLLVHFPQKLYVTRAHSPACLV